VSTPSAGVAVPTADASAARDLSAKQVLKNPSLVSAPVAAKKSLFDDEDDPFAAKPAATPAPAVVASSTKSSLLAGDDEFAPKVPSALPATGSLFGDVPAPAVSVPVVAAPVANKVTSPPAAVASAPKKSLFDDDEPMSAPAPIAPAPVSVPAPAVKKASSLFDDDVDFAPKPAASKPAAPVATAAPSVSAPAATKKASIFGDDDSDLNDMFATKAKPAAAAAAAPAVKPKASSLFDELDDSFAPTKAPAPTATKKTKSIFDDD
jgi:hypothetical protein